VLAVGIALNVLAFSVVNAYLLRPLPYPGGERLVAVNTWNALSWTEVSEVFDLAVSWDLDVFTLVGDGRPELVRGAWITPDFLEAYGVEPALGRTLSSDEAGRGGASVAMISHRLWRDRFGGDPGALGRTFRAYMSDRPEEAELFTIVGVLPEDYWYLNDFTDVLVPIREERAVYTARLRPGVGVEEAERYVAALAAGRIENAPPDFQVSVVSLRDQYVRGVRPSILVLQVAVFLVLLIACANAGVLVMVRSTRREREFGVRRALGAGRTRIVRQHLAEGLLVAGLAAVLGVALAGLAIGPTRDLVVERLGRSAPGGIEALTIDGSVVAVTVALTLLVGLLFGLVPLVVSRSRSLTAGLRDGGRGGDTKHRRRLRDAMVVTEVALSLALLSGAGSMVRSALHLQRRDIGFDPSRVVTGEVGLREASYPDAAERHAFFDRLVARMRELPGVEAAAITAAAPFTNTFETGTVEGEQAPAFAEAVSGMVGDGYFQAMGIPILRGRDFGPSDDAGSEPVAIVSESLADELWPGQDPLGRGVRDVARSWVTAPPEPEPFRRVIGVVGDIEREVGGVEGGDVYRPYRQASRLWMDVIARARPGAPPLVPAIEGVLRDLDPEVPLAGVVQLEEAVEAAAAPTRFMATLLSGLSAFAFLLAVVGLYGVIAYAARERRRDIAIRMALGADRSQVVGLFLSSGMAIAAAGVVLGLGGGVVLSRALEGQLHGVRPGDPATLALLAGALLATALAAVWIPARGAARSDPMEVLREE
jgi:putative ABC transport system permease protein